MSSYKKKNYNKNSCEGIMLQIKTLKTLGSKNIYKNI